MSSQETPWYFESANRERKARWWYFIGDGGLDRVVLSVTAHVE